MYVYRKYEIYISLSAGFKKSFNLLLFQKTEGIALNRLRSGKCDSVHIWALEGRCRGGNKWTRDLVAEASNVPFPSSPSQSSRLGRLQSPTCCR